MTPSEKRVEKAVDAMSELTREEFADAIGWLSNYCQGWQDEKWSKIGQHLEKACEEMKES